MNNKELLVLYGLKWNPFIPDIPTDALWSPPGMDNFLFRLENLVMDGGFALISGEPGLGKSKSLHILASRLERLEDAVGLRGYAELDPLVEFTREAHQAYVELLHQIRIHTLTRVLALH